MTTKLKTLLGLGLCLAGMNSRAFVVLQDSFTGIGAGNTAIDTNSGFVWGPGPGNAPLADYVNLSGGFVTTQGTSSKADQPWRFFTNGDYNATGTTLGTLGSYPINYSAAGNTYFPSSQYPNGFYYFPSNSPETALYYSFTLNVATPPNHTTVESAYFCYLTDTNFDYRCRLWTCTNTALNTNSNFRLGVSSSSSAPTNSTNVVQMDLSYGTTYQVVARFINSSGLSSVWIEPVGQPTLSETNTNSGTFATSTGTVSTATNITANNFPTNGTAAFGFRNYYTGALTIGPVIVGTQFKDVLPASVNPPDILIQPVSSPNEFEGQSVTFTTLATGDPTITYQWYQVTNTPGGLVTNALSGQTGSSLTLNPLTTNETGYYYAAVANPSDGGVPVKTTEAQLIVAAMPVAPVIQAQPVSITNNTGDTATFTVVSTNGVPPATFEWFWVTNSMTGLKTNLLAGQTTSTLTLNTVTSTNDGSYFVIVTNYLGGTPYNGAYGYSVTSSVVTLTVNPPVITSIYSLRTNTTLTSAGTYRYYAPNDTTSLYIVEGTVISWTNMTSSGNTEFYLQDNTGGIDVFWSGAPASNNLPAAGDIVKVTAPLAEFDGLLEIEPVAGNSLESVQIISTGNPLPAAQPLPFDPSLTGNQAEMNNLQSSYFVASNVFLAATPTYVAGATESITNILGSSELFDTDQSGAYDYGFVNPEGGTFTIYWNSYTEIPGKTKPQGPVTVFGVLGFFEGTYELTPTRLEDIITYTTWTNVLGNVSRLGDALTNSYQNSVVRPGENLTMNAYMSDPTGGKVTITSYSVSPTPAGVATWSGVDNSPANGHPATATLYFAPSVADEGTSFTVTVNQTDGDGPTANTWTIYVPTADEQQVYITEFLADPTTNATAKNFNPLGRPNGDVTSVTSWDQYVEVANLSPDPIYTYNWSIYVGQTQAYQDETGNTLGSSNYFLVYGGGNSGDPSAPENPLFYPANIGEAGSTGLFLPTTGQGVISLYNGSGDNNGQGDLIDRVVYSASQLNTNGSLSRFPTVSSGFVPQPWISTHWTTAGEQYDGGSWGLPTTVPAPVTGHIGVAVGTPAADDVTLSFTTVTTKASTLWEANSAGGVFQVVNGYKAPTTSGSLIATNANGLPAEQFYFITTQP